MGFIRGYDWEGGEKPAAMVYLTPKLRIRLTDPEKVPVAGGKCRLADDPATVIECDKDGIAEIPLRDRALKELDLEWERPGMDGAPEAQRFPWRNTFEVDIPSAQEADCRTRLTHLGFLGEDLAAQVAEYQSWFGLSASGALADIRTDLVNWHDGGNAPEQGGSATDAMPPAEELSTSKAKRKIYVTQWERYDFDLTEAALGKRKHYEMAMQTKATRDEILEAMRAADPGDIYVYEGHTYHQLGGPSLGVCGQSYVLGTFEYIPKAELGGALSANPPKVVFLCACNTDELFKVVRAAGVKLVIGIHNEVKDGIPEPALLPIADLTLSYLVQGLTISDALAKANDYLMTHKQHNNNEIVSEPDDDVDLEQNLDDNGL